MYHKFIVYIYSTRLFVSYDIYFIEISLFFMHKQLYRF